MAQGTTAADTSLMGRMQQALRGLLRRGTVSDSERYLAAIDASSVTPEQRRQAIDGAVSRADIEAGIDEADAAHERHVKGMEAGGVHRRDGAAGPAGS